VTLISDDFNRADSDTLDGWSELEVTDTQIGIRGDKMVFVDTSDAANQPMAREDMTSHEFVLQDTKLLLQIHKMIEGLRRRSLPYMRSERSLMSIHFRVCRTTSFKCHSARCAHNKRSTNP
jgi:hypothetical protein